MTSIKEALERIKRTALDTKPEDVPKALAHIVRLCIDADRALAQLESDDARETIARIIKMVAFGGDRNDEPSPLCYKVASAILATGPVPDEAAIRADEREKCANICRQVGINAGRRAAEHDNDEARNSALDKMESAIQCEAAIRAGRAEG